MGAQDCSGRDQGGEGARWPRRSFRRGFRQGKRAAGQHNPIMTMAHDRQHGSNELAATVALEVIRSGETIAS